MEQPLHERRAEADRRRDDANVTDDQRRAERRAEDLRKREAAERRRYRVGRVAQAVDYVFYLLYGLLTIRFALALLGASESAGFVQFVHGLTAPFYGPFSGIVERPSINGGIFDFPLLIAMLAYGLLHVAIRGLLRLLAGPPAHV